MTTTERIHGADCGHPCTKCDGPRVWRSYTRKDGKAQWRKHCKTCTASNARKRYNQDPSAKEDRAQDLSSRQVGDLAPACKKHGTPRTWTRPRSGWKAVCRECRQEEYQRRKPKANKATQAYYQANKEKHKALMAKWRKANPQRYRDIESKRRATKLGAGTDGLPVRLSPNAKCYICLSAPVEHIDHVIPLAKGGSDRLSNKAGACACCNTAKGAHVWPGSPGWDEFLEKRRGART